MKRWPFLLLAMVILGVVVVIVVRLNAGKTWPTLVHKAHGALTASFKDNADELSGVRSLTHASAPDVQAFGSGGLNYEHVISGVPDVRNRFTPRKGPLELRESPHGASLHRPADESPWEVAAVMSYTITPPHFIDFEFEATITDASQFQADEVTFFFASYMKNPHDYEIMFRGLPAKGAGEQWVMSRPTGRKATIYAAEGAPDLQRDPTDSWHNLHLTQEPYPRIAQPYYFARVTAGMVYGVMFDRLVTPDDEMRFAVFRWDPKKPAWDFEYVARNLSDGKKVGFKGRMVWKPFVSHDEITKIYKDWKPR